MASTSPAQIPTGNIKVTLQQVAGGLPSPVQLTHAGDGSGRLFVVDQAGQIRVIQNGVLLNTPFLDLSSKIPSLNSIFDERGLLGLAFHPNYAQNGRFFVRYSVPRTGSPSEPCNDPSGFIVGCHKERLSEFLVSGDPNVADPLSEKILFEVDKPQFNHNGGHVAFGPDGFFYFSLGDGGGAHDGLADNPPSHGSIGNGQNINAALGKVLRINVDAGTPYSIPSDNPFVGKTGLDEIYAYGFRNPYRFSFDLKGTKELWVADVGQNLFEEIDVVVKGGNYGWVIREGKHCFDPFNPTIPPVSCPSSGLTDPVAEYDHSDGIAVIGGYVYRGKLHSELWGKYIFGEFSRDFGPTGRLIYIAVSGDRSKILEFQLDQPLGLFVKGLGEDESGEIYLLTSTALGPSGSGGQVYKIIGSGNPVPTLSRWALIIFSLLLFGNLTWFFYRKRNFSIPTASRIFLLVFTVAFFFSSTL